MSVFDPKRTLELRPLSALLRHILARRTYLKTAIRSNGGRGAIGWRNLGGTYSTPHLNGRKAVGANRQLSSQSGHYTLRPHSVPEPFEGLHLI
jgi:hypothetical protein